MKYGTDGSQMSENHDRLYQNSSDGTNISKDGLSAHERRCSAGRVYAADMEHSKPLHRSVIIRNPYDDCFLLSNYLQIRKSLK